MKRLTLAALTTILLILAVVAMAQERKMDRRKHVQMMEMMRDSTMVNMMMEHMAKDNHMREMMMQKMMQSAKGDEAKMMAMCKAMIEDKDVHSRMMKMMDGEKQTAESAAANEILIKFKPDVKDGQIESMASEVGLEQVKVIKELNLRVFEITSGKSVDEVIEHCRKEPFVEYAEPNLTYKAMKK